MIKLFQNLKVKKGVSMLLSAVMLSAVLVAGLGGTVYADTKQQELEAKKQSLQQELAAAKEELASIQDKKQDDAATLTNLEGQANIIKQQISVLVSQITDTKQLVQEKQDEVDAKQAEIDKRWSDFKARVSAMQELRDKGAVALLSSVTNLYELLTFNETLQEISEKDNQVLDELEAARKELAEEQQQLEEEQAQLENQQSQLASKENELAVNIQSTNAELTADEAAEQAAKESAAAAQAEFDAAANALDAYIQEQNRIYGGTTISCSKNFICPVSYKYISCQYGANGHKGVDMAASSGTPIKAVASGTVTISAYHYSYGNYVQIYHGADDDGNTYATLYAHMVQTPSVSVGQSVSQGEVIGYVGSTGNSTGPHLHLELRVNGGRTNPLNYIPH